MPEKSETVFIAPARSATGDEASESEAPRVVVVTGLSRWP